MDRSSFFLEKFEASPLDMPGAKPERVEYTIHEDYNTLMLRCESCQENWCDHIHEGISQNLDAPTLWHVQLDAPEREILGAIDFPIPITPTIKQWTPIVLERASNDMCRIVVEYSSAWDDLEIDGNSPGYFSRGEGRFILRETVLQWFNGLVMLYDLHETLSCQNPTHSYQANAKWFEDLSKPQHAFQQLWSVFMTQKCLVCLGLDRFRLEPGSGLVPDSQNRTYSDLVPRG